MKLNLKNVLCVILILFLGTTVNVLAGEPKAEESKEKESAVMEDSKVKESSPVKITVHGAMFLPVATKVARVDPFKGFGICCHVGNYKLNFDYLKGEGVSEDYPGMSVEAISSLSVFSVQYINVLPEVNGSYYGAGIGTCIEKVEITVEYEYYGRKYIIEESVSGSVMILELVAGYVENHLDISARFVLLPSSENVTSALLCAVGYRF